MPLYFAYVDAIDEPFGPAHLRNDEDVLRFALEGRRGEIYTATIEIPNPGLALLRPGRKKFCLISYGPEGDVGATRLIARGRISALPESISGPTVTLTITCAPEDVDDRLKERALPLRTMPHWDEAVDGIDLDRPQDAVLLTRNEFWSVDPATHDIYRVSHIPVTAPIPLEYIEDSLQLSAGEAPVKSVKAKVFASWTQNVTGLTDIAPRVNPVAQKFISFNQDFLQYSQRDMPGFAADIETGAGWSLDKTKIVGERFQSPLVITGRQVTYTYIDQEILPPGPGNINGIVRRVGEGSINDDEMISFEGVEYFYRYLWVRYDYNQPREETVEIEMSVPAQDVGYGVKPLDLGEIRLRDLQTVQDVNPLEWGKVYDVDDEVFHEGWVWRCLAKTDGPHWVNGLYIGPKMEYLSQFYSYFTKTPRSAPMPEQSAARYFDTARGRQTLEHILLKMRAEALLRNQFLTVTVECEWDAAGNIGLRDSASVLLPAGEGQPLQPVTGKVTAVAWEWSGDGFATVKVTLAVSLGDGSNGAAPPPPPPGPYNPAAPILPLVYTGRVDTARDDVGYTVETEEVPEAIDIDLLNQPNYAVLDVQYYNLGGAQLYGAVANRFTTHPYEYIRENPTRISVIMRPLLPQDVVVRKYTCDATLYYGPRGIDMSTPGGHP